MFGWKGRTESSTSATTSEVSCHALLVAAGVQWRRSEAPGSPLHGAGRNMGAAQLRFSRTGANYPGRRRRFIRTGCNELAQYAERAVLRVCAEPPPLGAKKILKFTKVQGGSV